jgi:hypothetical protein
VGQDRKSGDIIRQVTRPAMKSRVAATRAPIGMSQRCVATSGSYPGRPRVLKLSVSCVYNHLMTPIDSTSLLNREGVPG